LGFDWRFFLGKTEWLLLDRKTRRCFIFPEGLTTILSMMALKREVGEREWLKAETDWLR
jgi:hypothetical protein